MDDENIFFGSSSLANDNNNCKNVVVMLCLEHRSEGISPHSGRECEVRVRARSICKSCEGTIYCYCVSRMLVISLMVLNMIRGPSFSVSVEGRKYPISVFNGKKDAFHAGSSPQGWPRISLSRSSSRSTFLCTQRSSSHFARSSLESGSSSRACLST